ncbi:MAG: MFS transporter [Anaerolineales bacterium]|nr:MFS transporter [Anaerolineales bacterium]
MLKDLTNPKEFPRPFWILMGATLIDQTGRFLLVPYFGLYITSRFGISMTELGEMFFLWAAFGILGSFASGALTDKLGRRFMLIAGLLFSAGISLFLGLASDLRLVFALAAVVGFLSDIGGPAQAAMVADLLPAARRADGFGIWRVVVNIAAVIGPLAAALLVAGGGVAEYFRLFVADAVLSALTALIVFFALAETRPAAAAQAGRGEGLGQALLGYRHVLGNLPYMAFIVISILPVLAYAQMNTTMPVYMRDVGGIPPLGYSYVLATNALLVVLLQFWVTRKIGQYAPLPMLALGSLLYAIGFGAFGLTNLLPLLLLAAVVFTFGEMVAAPVGQAVASLFAPAEMRGRYLAMFNFSWALPFAIGPYLAGQVWEQVAPQWVWYGAFALGVAGMLGYLVLHLRVGERLRRMAGAEKEK